MRATAVEVAVAAAAVRGEVVAGARMKIWLGFLDPALESRVSFETGEDDGAGADVAFVTQAGGSGFLPHCDALVEVAKDKFQFHTATEHTGAEAPPPTRDRGQDGSDRTSSRSHVFLDSGAGFLRRHRSRARLSL